MKWDFPAAALGCRQPPGREPCERTTPRSASREACRSASLSLANREGGFLRPAMTATAPSKVLWLMITSARTPGNVSCPLMGMADQSYYAGDGLNKTLLTPALGLGLSAARSQPGPQRCTLRTRFEAGPANQFSVRPPGSTFLSAETAGQSRGRDRVWLARDGNRRECCRLTS